MFFFNYQKVPHKEDEMAGIVFYTCCFIRLKHHTKLWAEHHFQLFYHNIQD